STTAVGVTTRPRSTRGGAWLMLPILHADQADPGRPGPPAPGARSEEPGLRVVQAAHGVVVQHQAADAAVLGQHPGLRLDLLGGEDALDGAEVRVAVEQFEVAGELFDAVDLPAPLDLYGHRPLLRVAGEDVHRPDRGGVLPPHEPVPRAEQLDLLGEELLEVGLPAVLDEARVPPEVVGAILDGLVEPHDEPVVALGVLDGPDLLHA